MALEAKSIGAALSDHRAFLPVFAYALIERLVALPLRYNLSDGGYQFYLAWAVSERRLVLYRDVFTLYAPGQAWLPGAFMELAGFSFYNLRLYQTLMSLSVFMAVYLLVRRFTQQRWLPVYVSLFLALTWIPVGMPGQRVLFAMPFLYVGWGALEGGLTRPRVVILGTFAGLGALMSQEVGLYLVVGFVTLVVLVRAREIRHGAVRPAVRDLTGFLVTCLAVLAPVLVYFHREGALPTLVHDLTLGVVDFSASMSIPFLHPLLRPFATFAPTPIGIGWSFYYLAIAVLFVIPPVLFVLVAGWTGYSVGVRGDPLSAYRDVLWLLVISILFFVTAMGRSDASHLGFAYPFVLILLAVTLDRTFSGSERTWSDVRSRDKRALFLAAVLVTIPVVGAGLGQATFYAREVYNPETTYVEPDLPYSNNLRVPEQEYKTVAGTVSLVRAHTEGDDRFLALPWVPGYYPILGRTSPVRFVSFLPGELDEGDVERTIAVIDENDTTVVYYPDRRVQAGGKQITMRSYYPRLHDYIVDRCSLIGTVDSTAHVYRCV